MRHVVMVLIAVIAGCGPIQVQPTAGKYFTTQHGTARFNDAMEGARQHCATMGLDAKHLGTDHTGALLLSRFECIAR